MQRFAQKTALVTGAGSGIGRAAARALVSEGARVALVDRASTDELVEELGQDHASAHVIDVSSAEAVDDGVESISERLGPIDVVLANAGITRDGFVEQLTDQAWEDVLRVNLSGAFYVSRACFPRLRDGGAIVMTSSISALGNLGQANYAASKAGLIGLARTLALEGARRAIRVNCVAPGFTDTPMVQAVPQKVKQKLLERVPLARLARPEEIANVMLFLASDEASYITGQVIFADGGASVGLH